MGEAGLIETKVEMRSADQAALTGPLLMGQADGRIELGPQALASKLGAIDGLELLNDGSAFPVVALRASDPDGPIDLDELSRRLREHGWIVPAYTLPANAEHITVLRMVVKENFSRDMVDMLAHDVHTAIRALQSEQAGRPHGARTRPHC
jgi:glutamate decarboxylase